MSTRGIVPRANNEGELGTPTKAWAEANIKSINVSSINVPMGIAASNGTLSSGTILIAGGSNVTVGTTTGNQIIINAGGGSGGGGGAVLAAGTQTGNTSGSVLFQNSNNVSFGMSNSSIITASIPSIPTTFDNLSDGTTNKAFTNTEKKLLKNLLSTGLLKGGIVTINIDTSKFDMTALYGIIVDNTDTENPTLTSISVEAQTEVIDIYSSTDPITYITINSSGNIILTPVYPDEDARRNVILIGWLDHPEMTGEIINAWTEPYYNADIQSQMNDFFENFGPFNISGNIYSSYSGLQIQRSEGATFDSQSNYALDNKNPHVLYKDAEIPVTFIYYYRDVIPGTWVDNGSEITYIDPNYWDNGSGTLQSVNTNYWTIQSIAWYPLTDSNDIQYGQEEFASLTSAKAGLRNAILVDPYNIYDVYRGWLIVKQGATDLTDPTQALFIAADSALKMIDLQNDGGGVLVITEHNDLDNIQGGQQDERYHLDVARYNDITAGSYQYSSIMTNYQLATTNINAVSISGNNTSGTMANISSGTMYMAGGNNITISQNSNSITISGANVGGVQTGISGIAGSAASTVTDGTVVFANLNGISFGLNSVTMTASHNAIMTSVSSLFQHTSATSAITVSAINTSQSSLFQHTSATSNNTSLAMNTSERTKYVQEWAFAGVQTAGTTSSAQGSRVYLSAGNMMTLSGNSNTIILSMNSGSLLGTGAVASFVSTSQSSLFQHVSATSAITVSAVNTSQSSLFQHTSATSNVTSLAMNTSERASLQYTSANTIFVRGFGAPGTTYNTGTIIFSGVNATINTSLNGVSQYIGVSVAAPGAANESNQMNLSGNVAGNTTASGSTINWVGGNNITLSGLNNSQIRIDAAAGGAGVAVAGSGASTVTNGTVQFGNLNGVSFGLNGSTMTASCNASNDVSQWSLVGNNTAGTTVQNISNNIMYLSGGNNITLSGNVSTLVISGAAAGGGGITYHLYEPFDRNNTGTIQSNATLFLSPVSINQYVTGTRAVMIASIAESVNATLSEKATASVAAIIYTLSNDNIRLQTVSSGSQSYSFNVGSGSSTNSVSFTGYRNFTIPININATPGLYWIGMWSMTSISAAGATNNSFAITAQGVAPKATAWYANDLSLSNNSVSTTCMQLPGHGYVTVSRSNTNLSLPVFIARSTAAGATTNMDVSFASRVPYIVFKDFDFPIHSN